MLRRYSQKEILMRLEVVGLVATARLTDAIKETGQRDSQMRLQTLLSRVIRSKEIDGLLLSYQGLGFGYHLFRCVDERSEPREGWALLSTRKQHDLELKEWVKITWSPQHDHESGKYLYVPEIKLPVDIELSRGTNYSFHLNPILLEILGHNPVELVMDLTGMHAISSLPGSGLEFRDRYPHRLIFLGDAVDMAAKYLQTLERLRRDSKPPRIVEDPMGR